MYTHNFENNRILYYYGNTAVLECFSRNKCIETRPSVIFQIDSVWDDRPVIDFIAMLIIFYGFSESKFSNSKKSNKFCVYVNCLWTVNSTSNIYYLRVTALNFKDIILLISLSLLQ